MKLKFPKLARTLIKKILQDNPWGLGKEIEIIVLSNWDKMKESENVGEFAKYFESFGRKHYLSSFHVASYFQESYL